MDPKAAERRAVDALYKGLQSKIKDRKGGQEHDLEALSAVILGLIDNGIQINSNSKKI